MERRPRGWGALGESSANMKGFAMRTFAGLLLLLACAFVGCSQQSGIPQGAAMNGRPSGFAAPLALSAAHSKTTNPSGRVVDDPSGSPLAGISVRLLPWSTGCTWDKSTKIRTCPDYLKHHKTHTDGDGRFALHGVPNGEYLLVIGSDDPSDYVRATVHARVSLTGGNQELRAPTLPAVPCVHEAELDNGYCLAMAKPGTTPFPVPAVETHGAFRLVTLSPETEVPCISAFNQKRVDKRLPPVVEDEWEAELARTSEGYITSGVNLRTAQPQPGLEKYGQISIGGAPCPVWVKFWTSTTKHASAEADPLLLWYSAIDVQKKPFNEYALLHIDPRVTDDYYSAKIPLWP